MAPHIQPDAAVPVRWQQAPTPLGAGHVVGQSYQQKCIRIQLSPLGRAHLFEVSPGGAVLLGVRLPDRAAGAIAHPALLQILQRHQALSKAPLLCAGAKIPW